MPALKPRRVHLLQVAAFSFAAWFGTAQSFAQGKSAPDEVPPSHVDIYGGYAYIHPFHSAIAGVPYHDVGNINTTVSITDYFTRHFGVQVEGSYFSGGSKHGIAYQCAPSCASRDQLFYAAEAGPIFRFPQGRFTPYVHVLAGGARVNGPYAQPLTWGAGLTGGGGLDYTLPFAGNHLALRLFQADMYYSHVDYGNFSIQSPVSTANFTTRSNVGDVLAVKGSAGLVVKFGSVGPPPAPLTLVCTVQPETAYPGDPITVTCTPGNLNPKRPVTYSFTSPGLELTANGPTATISTTHLEPGSFTVMSHVKQGSKPLEQGSWTGSFSIQSFDPPIMTACVASPSEIVSGDTATVTATATSPQNRPLVYTYSASAGQVSGTGPTATFSSAGLAPGRVTINCNVSDDKDKRASSTTTVTVSQPTPSAGPVPSRSLCSISFARDRKRPVRVNNEAKACLDDIALTLQREYTDKLVIVGHQDAGEFPQAAAQRANNESLYLKQEKGIDAARLELRASTFGGQTVDNILLPLGATSPASSGSTVVDPSTIPQSGEAYGRPRAKGGAHVRRGKHKGGSHRQGRHSKSQS